MNVEYHKWWSPQLSQDMELKIYGHSGKPALIFPAQGGRFYEFEDFGMVHTIASWIEAGQLTLFTVDSIDSQSWANWGAPLAERGRRHEDYDRYICNEVVPFIRQRCGGNSRKLLTAGCSMGGYHAANFFFRHPDVFDAVISISGLFQLSLFTGDTVDDGIYFNSPLLYLPGLDDPWYLDQYRQSQILICVGQGAWEDLMIRDARRMQEILAAKNIPAAIDLWGGDVNHDWPWWRKMLPYLLGKLDLS